MGRSIYTEALRIADRTVVVADLGVPLQMGVLLGTLHHVEQRLYADRTPARVFHEQCLVGEKPVFQTGGRAVEIRDNLNNLGSLAPHARHQLQFFIGITPKFGKNKKKSENTNM